jgi:YesN/AraC family two-component response regulator
MLLFRSDRELSAELVPFLERAVDSEQVRVFIGRTFENLWTVKRELAALRRASESAFYTDYAVSRGGRTIPGEPPRPETLSAAFEQLRTSLELSSLPAVREAANSLIHSLRTQRRRPSLVAEELETLLHRLAATVPVSESLRVPRLSRLRFSRCCSQFQSALADLVRTRSENGATQSDRRVSAALDYIDRHFREALSLDRVASAVNTSPEHLARILRERTGETFLQRLTRRRVELAAQLLRQSAEPVAEIGRRVGYEEPVTFSRAFKRVLGTSPRAFRDGLH